MDKKDVIDHFGSQTATARALGITVQAVNAWPDKIPEGRAYQIQIVTNGVLSVEKQTAA